MQMDTATSALNNGQRAFSEIASSIDLQRAATILKLYRIQLEQYTKLAPNARTGQQQVVRNTGRELSGVAGTFSSRERTVLAQSVRAASWTLVAVFVSVLLLGIGSAFFLVRQVVRPLSELESQLDALAEGQDQHLTLPS